jgi:hypothetical protein
MEIYQVPPYPTGKPETKILPSVRGCEGVSSVSGDDVPDQGKEFIRNTTTVVTPVHLYIEGPSNPPSAPGDRPHRTPTLLLGPHHVFTPSHWNCPSTTLFLSFLLRRSCHPKNLVPEGASVFRGMVTAGKF